MKKNFRRTGKVWKLDYYDEEHAKKVAVLRVEERGTNLHGIMKKYSDQTEKWYKFYYRTLSHSLSLVVVCDKWLPAG
jgi:hypothetical protein